MSLFEEKKGNIIQELFQAGNRKYYLRNKDKPESVHTENVLKALDYLEKRQAHYSELEKKIIMMLPQSDRDNYLSAMIERNKHRINEYISSLSDPLKQQYTSKGKKIAEDQTRLRSPKQIRFHYDIEINIDQRAAKTDVINYPRIYISPRKSVFIIQISQIQKFTDSTRNMGTEQFFNYLESKGAKIAALSFENYKPKKEIILNPHIIVFSSPNIDDKIKEKFYANGGEMLEKELIKIFSISEYDLFSILKNNNYITTWQKLSSSQTKDILTKLI